VQCLVATDRANTPAASRQFERGSAIHGQLHACPSQKSKALYIGLEIFALRQKSELGVRAIDGGTLVEVLQYPLSCSAMTLLVGSSDA